MARGPLAGAAGPGKFSVRTDGLTLPSQSYGEGVQTQQIMQGAPLAKTPDVRGAQGSQVKAAAAAAPAVTSLYAPTERPQEPITTGIPLGPGAGPEVMGMRAPAGKLSDALAKMLPFDTTGEIAILYQEALSRGN